MDWNNYNMVEHGPDTYLATVRKLSLGPGLDYYLIIDYMPDGCVRQVRVSGLHIGADLRRMGEMMANAINAAIGERNEVKP